LFTASLLAKKKDNKNKNTKNEKQKDELVQQLV